MINTKACNATEQHDDLGIDSLIGDTPLVDVSQKSNNNSGRIFAKCEFFNPGMSLKDRIAANMINNIDISLMTKSTIVCASSGNTGCSVAMLGKKRGMRVIVVTSNKCSQEKINHIKSYGAEVIVVDNGVDYIDFAKQYSLDNEYYNIDQYNNPYNESAYYNTLGPEIWRQTGGNITHFIMTGSSFGCISGTSRYLKEKNSNIKVILADPKNSNISNYYSDFKNNINSKLLPSKPYIIEGAGKSNLTSLINFSLIDDVISVSDVDAIKECRKLAEINGIFVGGSSGLNMAASKIIQKNTKPKDIIVTIFCDSGVKYLSKIYNPDFLSENGIDLPVN